jgi:hypothetical protein
MSSKGWKQLIDGWPWFQGAGSFPLLPNSEFMQPVRLVRKPYGSWDTTAVSEDDPWGWPITEYEEMLTLRPGLCDLARHILDKLVPLCQGDKEHGISEYKLHANPYWPAELAARAGTLEHERFVLLLPLALSQTQDDKAHVRWTLFGNSELTPARAFWKGFFTAPGQELAADAALTFFRDLLACAYDEPRERLANLRKAGFRILHARRRDGPLPAWAADFLLHTGESLRGVKYILTFSPFRDLPAGVRKKYLAGDLHLLPFPGSLLFWGVDSYARLGKHLWLAAQIPLLHFVERHEAFGKIRVPQSGWFVESGPAAEVAGHGHGPIRDTYKRTYRQARLPRFEDHLVYAREHRLPHTLFSTQPHDIDLYHKPMARNVQLWTHDYRPLLDGPSATPADIRRAAEVVANGGVFGYRFVFPAMQVGRHELYWHRPLVAYLDRRLNRPALIESAPTGYLTAYLAKDEGGRRREESKGSQPFSSVMVHPSSLEPLELWPRLLRRQAQIANVELFRHLEERPPLRTLLNVYKLLDAWERLGREPLPPTFARRLLTAPKRRTLEGWMRGLPDKVKPRHRKRARQLVKYLQTCLAAAKSKSTARPASNAIPRSNVAASCQLAPTDATHSLTFKHTASRAFEEDYWNTIAHLSSGDYVNKNNADCVLDKPTQALLVHKERDLEGMGDYLLDYYAHLAASSGMADALQLGELPFRWHTEYHFPWMGGWLNNQEGRTYERNLLVRIPGRDRSRAVIMADHYDTAYMHDCYDRSEGGTGARLAAQGADDNCSATAALMLGARAFLDLSKRGKLDCDVWLLHLTGEEYPAEGLGTCRMCQWLVEGTLALHTAGGACHDLSGVRIQGVYVLDMIAHNVDDDRDVFQIAPGAGPESLWLAYQAHLANEAWNASTVAWNRQPPRRRAGRGQRSQNGRTIPALAQHLALAGEIRPHYDPRSTLFNTDGQAFSDFGIPVVLFMENYDINRLGYHDTYDNMTMIDLDYGAALAAVTIEAVARAATQKPASLDGAARSHLEGELTIDN